MPTAHGGATNGVAVGALVLGILAILFGFLFFPVGIILGIVGIVLGVMGRNAAKRDPSIGREGMALAGLITSIIGIIIGVVLLVVTVIFVGSAVNTLENSPDFQEQLETLTIPQE